jgi:hypothetical protein
MVALKDAGGVMDLLARRVWRWIGRVGAIAVLSGMGLSAQAASLASLEVVALPDSVTRSTVALPTYASYRITITSLVRDHLNNMSFKGAVSVQGSTQSATLFGTDGASCTLSAGVLDCAVPGALGDTGQAASFTVTLKTPTAGSAIVLAGQATLLAHCCGSTQTNAASATTALAAPAADSFSTYVPTAQTPATLYSGTRTQGGVVGSIPIVDALTNDPFTTTVIVPGGSPATTASVSERDVAQSCSANPRCFESKLLIPGSFDFLTIILRRDRTTLNPYHTGQSELDNAIVKYYPDDDPANPDKFIIVPNCSVVPGGLPTAKNPCIASRKAYPVPRKGKPAVPPGLEGDWEFVIRALDNGRYVN